MSKRIIFCADGTWDNKKNDTNIFKLFQALPQTTEQVAFYDDGVGSDGNFFEKFLGGAFGHGLFKKVKEGYQKIASVYEPGDEIFIFGFSRGAYTARSIAGMIADCGLPVRDGDKSFVDKVFDAYRHKHERADILKEASAEHKLYDAPIKMVGVFDTVGSLGVPAIFGGVDPISYGFLDTSLHPNIKNAYQALAIDEHRREFPPTLWTAPQSLVPGQVLEQVWFPGVHCDVGGGYAETGLSDITLGWMMDKAEKLGLKIQPDIAAKYRAICTDAAAGKAAALDKMHHSWDLFWGIPRKRTLPPDATLSDSVVARCAADKSYRPGNLDLVNGLPGGSYQLARAIAPAALPGAPPSVQFASVAAPAVIAAPSSAALPAPPPSRGQIRGRPSSSSFI